MMRDTSSRYSLPKLLSTGLNPCVSPLGIYGIGCWLGVFLYIGIYICVLFVSIFLCLVHFAYLLASHHDMLFLMLLY